jgi:hypothetical protein
VVEDSIGLASFHHRIGIDTRHPHLFRIITEQQMILSPGLAGKKQPGEYQEK